MLGRHPKPFGGHRPHLRRPEDDQETRRKALRELERVLLHLGRFAFFSFGYYFLSRWIVNWWLSKFTETGWQFDWNLFSSK